MALLKENKLANLDLYTSTTMATLLDCLWEKAVPLTQQCRGRQQYVHGFGNSHAGDAPLANAGDPREKRNLSWTSPSGKYTMAVAPARSK